MKEILKSSGRSFFAYIKNLPLACKLGLEAFFNKEVKVPDHMRSMVFNYALFFIKSMTGLSKSSFFLVASYCKNFYPGLESNIRALGNMMPTILCELIPQYYHMKTGKQLYSSLFGIMASLAFYEFSLLSL
jgi:hypothetical protein